MTEPPKFDPVKGSCQHCAKPTRSSKTGLCQACYKLQVAIINNPQAAESILREVKHEDN